MTKLSTKTLLGITQKAMTLLLALALAFSGSMAIATNASAQISELHVHDSEWDVSGDYVWQFNYEGTDYAHNVTLTQDENFDLTGDGESNGYTWEITSGGVSNAGIDFDAEYTATEDA